MGVAGREQRALGERCLLHPGQQGVSDALHGGEGLGPELREPPGKISQPGVQLLGVVAGKGGQCQRIGRGFVAPKHGQGPP